MTSNSSKLQPVRGTQDAMPHENKLFRYIEETAFKVACRYGFGEISTPIFEFTEVFSRTLGDNSDIVTKEMYTFKDRGGDYLTLRPEGTAGVARAVISNGLAQDLPLKLFYRGPMFRYERPQKGRRRQFQQVGIEIIGVSETQADIETIALGQHFLADLGIDKGLTLEINTLGDLESRTTYRGCLVDYLSDYQSKLSKDSALRLSQNPLRILDSKNEDDREIVAGAPLLKDSLNDASKRLFDDLLNGLTQLKLEYIVNDKLVRGLDYYSHTAFEFTSRSLGAQSSVLAGGRYDGLISQMGGPEIPGIGWAAGVERLSLLLDNTHFLDRPISVIPVNKDLTNEAINLADRLRRKGFNVELGYSGNLSKRMKRANKANSCAVIILGADEFLRNKSLVRDMDSGEQVEVSLEHLNKHLEPYK